MGEGHTEPTGGDRRDRQRLTVPEAATVLGMTVDAVRGRIRRGSLDSEREGGTVYVYVDAEPTDRRDQTATVEGPSADDALLEAKDETIAELRARIESLERRLDRSDHLLAAALERIPAIEPPEPQNEPESAEPRSDRGTPPEETEEPTRPFWRRWFGA